MFKVLLSTALLLGASMAAAAPTQDKCLQILEAKLKADSVGQDWGYEAISTAAQTSVKDLIDDALAEDEEEDRSKMYDFMKDANIGFYVFSWTAPSNEGTTLLAVDKQTCDVKEDLLLWSQE